MLAALTEKPERIEKMFNLSQMNVAGIWAIDMYKNGMRQEVVMDDFIPCKNGVPCFSRAHGNELWVIILEKAWAKLHGSYERIEAGLCTDVMRDLTGAPSFSMLTTEKGLEQKLLDFDTDDYIMAASCGTNASDVNQLESMGLVAAHAYTLVAVKLIELKPQRYD